jgi:hypothetical protein
MKPIVGDQLKYFVHGFNIQGYDGGDTWVDSFGSGQVTYVVSSSLVESRGRRRTFNTLGTAEIGAINSNDLNPGTGSYSMTVWFKANSNKGYIFEKGNQFNCFLTGTNHLLMYIMPQSLNPAYGLAVSGSYGFSNHNVSNNCNGFLAFDADTMEVKSTKWSYSIGVTIQGTYIRGMAIDSASFIWTGLDEAAKNDYSNDEWKTSVGTKIWDLTYATPGDPATNAVWVYDIDFNDEWTYHINQSLAFGGLTGWVAQRKKDAGGGAGPAASASHVSLGRGVCIDKLPLSTGSFVYATSTGWDSIVKLSQDSCSFIMSTGSLGTGQHQFSDPWGIACDQEYIYVADYNNERISIYDKQLRYVNHTQSIDSADSVSRPISISVTDKHIFYSTADGSYKIVKLDKTTLQISGTIQYVSVKGNGWYNYAPKAGWASGSHVFITNRSAQFTAFRKTEHGNFQVLGRDTSHGAGDCWGMEMNKGVINSEPTGQVWLTATDGDDIRLYNYDDYTTLTPVTTSDFGANGWGTFQWNSPRDSVLDEPNDWIFITDLSNHRIKKLRASDLNLLALTGSNVSGGISQSAQPVVGSGDHEFSSPNGITMSGSFIYVADDNNNRIQQFNTDLEYVDTPLSGLSDMYKVKFDNVTNSFYIFRSTRTIYRYDKDWNLISSVDYTAGQENPDMISGFAYLSWFDDEFIYYCDLWRTIVFDKETLGWEGEIGPYKINMRSKAIDTGSWHSMTYTYDGSDMKLYVDGEYQTSASMVNYGWGALDSPGIQNTEPMRFGRWKWYSYAEQFVETRVGAVLVYGKTLNDGEIRQNYDALKWEFK